jgi:hypothetical protein
MPSSSTGPWVMDAIIINRALSNGCHHHQQGPEYNIFLTLNWLCPWLYNSAMFYTAALVLVAEAHLLLTRAGPESKCTERTCGCIDSTTLIIHVCKVSVMGSGRPFRHSSAVSAVQTPLWLNVPTQCNSRTHTWGWVRSIGRPRTFRKVHRLLFVSIARQKSQT